MNKVQLTIAQMSGAKLLKLALMLGVIDLARIEDDIRSFAEDLLKEALEDMGYVFE